MRCLQAYYKEIAVHIGLDHAHICPVLGVFLPPDHDSSPMLPCIVMPDMHYGSLEDFAERYGLLGRQSEVTRLVGQALL